MLGKVLAIVINLEEYGVLWAYLFPQVAVSAPQQINIGTILIGIIAVAIPFVIIISPGIIMYWWLTKDNGKNAIDWVPKINFISTKNKGELTKARVFPSDMHTFKDKVIIPEFHNVYLDYKTYGDFKKYLNKVEILGIPRGFRVHGQFWNWKHKNKKGELAKKRERNKYNFRCVFYFSKQPKRGHMDLVYH